MSFIMPIYLWLIIPFAVLFTTGRQKIIIKTHILILILILVSLARPVLKEVQQKSYIQAQEIILAVDISYSMQAKDISPTRYIFAKETITELLSRNVTDNFMLIAFTSNPLLLSPLSTDHALIGIALDNLNPNFILTRGTSLKKLFTKLSTLSQTPKTLILMTDGGEENNVKELATLLQKSHISLITLALGSKKGTTIEKKDGLLLKDKENNLVITRINPSLEVLTHQIGGEYLTADTSSKETASVIHSLLQKNKNIQHTQKEQYLHKELYQIPLFIATLLFLLLHTRAVKYLIIFFTFLGLPLQASLLDNYYLHQAYQSYNKKEYVLTNQIVNKITKFSLQSHILLANSHYKEGDYKKAIEIYSSIKSTSVSIKQMLYYNTANAYIRLHKYTKAKLYYIKVLQLGFDEDALYNLKLAIYLKDKQPAPLGIAHPKSQSTQSHKKESSQKNPDQKREEDQSSSSSGGGEKEQTKKKEKKNKLLSQDPPQKQPLSSKVYDLINKGYIHEKQPW